MTTWSGHSYKIMEQNQIFPALCRRCRSIRRQEHDAEERMRGMREQMDMRDTLVATQTKTHCGSPHSHIEVTFERMMQAYEIDKAQWTFNLAHSKRWLWCSQPYTLMRRRTVASIPAQLSHTNTYPCPAPNLPHTTTHPCPAPNLPHTTTHPSHPTLHPCASPYLPPYSWPALKAYNLPYHNYRKRKRNVTFHPQSVIIFILCIQGSLPKRIMVFVVVCRTKHESYFI